MDVNELTRLAGWYIDQHNDLRARYKALLSPIQHNASQADKQPVEPTLEALLTYLREMTFEDLSLQQIQLLSHLGVEEFLGENGARLVEGLVRTADYDPATAAARLVEIIQALANANSGFDQYRNSLTALDLLDKEADEPQDGIIIRVGFQHDAAIENVTDWKDSARDWYDIIRGLALASNEAPEETRVVGASTGSIILILAGTLSVTTLLALISKNIASVAKEVLAIQNGIEDLRHKKWLNATIERELTKKIETTKANAVRTIIAGIKKRIKDIDGEQTTALESSIKKLLSFNEKGGNVDFVSPELDESDQESVNEDRSEFKEVRAVIREYQAVREDLKRITDQSS